MKSRLLAAGLCASALLIGTAASAAPNPGELEQTIAAKFQARAGQKPRLVTRTPVAGVWEVIVGRRIFYTDTDVKYLIAGQLFDIQTRANITQERMENVASRLDWKSLPLKDAIKVVYGKGERKVAVFTDINCSYCSKLETFLRQVGNVTVYNFIFPILNSRDAAEKLMCAKNPAQVFQDHMLNGSVIPAAPQKCDTSMLDRNLKLGRSWGFTGTPTIIFPDGQVAPGALPPAQLEQALQETNR